MDELRLRKLDELLAKINTLIIEAHENDFIFSFENSKSLIWSDDELFTVGIEEK